MDKKNHAERAHALRNWSSGEMWIKCAPWVDYKRQAEAGEIVLLPTDMSAADRGTKLHEILETLLRKMLKAPDTDSEKLLRAPLVKKLDDHDQMMVGIAFRSALAEMRSFGWPEREGLQVGLEVKVSLTHEPGQFAHVDLALIAVEGKKVENLGVYDFKFGLGAVAPDSTQNTGYGASLVAALRKKGLYVDGNLKVLLGIIQPELDEQAITHETTVGALNRFRHYADETAARQDAGLETRYAADPSVCTWCPFKLFKSKDGKDMACPANQRMMLEALDVAEEVAEGQANPRTVERFYRSKKMLEDALSQARDLILDNEEDFPDFTRGERRNPRGWDLDKADEGEIAHYLRINFDLKEPYRLKTPAQIAKELQPEDDFELFLKPETKARTLRPKK